MEINEIIRTCILSISAVSASIAVIWAINQYRLTKRDKIVSQIKMMLTHFKYNCEIMMSLLSYELVDEVVNKVVYSRNVEFGLYKFLHQIILEKNTEVKWPIPITAAVASPYLLRYQELMNDNNELCIEIGSILPSVSRIFEGVQVMFKSQQHTIKDLSHHEDLYEKITTDLIGSGINNPSLLKAHIASSLTMEISSHLSFEWDNIRDAIKLLEIVNNAFLSLKDKGIIKQVKLERKIKYQPIAETQTIFDDFHEAEKGLEKIMDHNNLMLFRELCVAIRVRNKMHNER